MTWRTLERVALALVLVTCWFASGSVEGLAADADPDPDRTTLEELVAGSRYEEAIELARELIEAVRAQEGPDSLAEAELLDSLLEALYRSGHAMDEESPEIAVRVVALKELHLGPDSPGVAESLLQSGNLHIYRSENVEARADYERALAILDAADAQSTPAYGVALNNLGVTWKRSGDYAKALDIYQRALAMRERTLGSDHPDVASSLNNIANALVNLGDYSGAIDCHRRALSIREAHYGPRNEWVAESLNNLATVLGYSGEYDEALAVQERAVEIFAEALGEDHERFWAARLNLAQLFSDMGDFDGAREIYSEVLEKQESRYGEDNAELIEALDALASCLAELDELAASEVLFRRSLAISEREYGVGNPWTSYTLLGLGECLADAGRHDEASAHLNRALMVQESAVDTDSPELCEFLHSLAELELLRGDDVAARSLAERSVLIAENSLGGDHPLLATALLLSARASYNLGEEELALEQALRAEAISRQHLRATMGVLSEHLALDYGSSRITGLDLALSILSSEEDGTRVAEVWDQVIRSRALVLDEMAARSRCLSELDDPATMALVAELRAARSRLAHLSLRGPGWEELSAYRLMLTQAREEKETAERSLALASRRFRQQEKLQAHGLDEVGATLEDGDQLLAFVRHGIDGESERYAVFALDGVDAAPRFVDLGPAAELDQLVTDWYEQAAYGSRVAESGGQTRGFIKRARDTEGQQEDYDAVARALRRRVWDPALRGMKDATRRCVVSDGSLHLVNFYALVEEGGAYVLESGSLIRFLPTERSLCASERPSSDLPRLLAVGDPSYPPQGPPESDADPDCPSLEGLRFEALHGARQEAEEILELWSRAPYTAPEPKLLLGSAATEAAIKRQAQDCEVLHLATHGFLLSGQCTDGLEAAGGQSNPLLLSGLALAISGEDADGDEGEEDGLLTAEEVAGLDLSDLDWAVLSACDTGLGEIRARGEGVFGLSRSFQVAGARTVVMSLWAVDDAATRHWMNSLYETRFTEGSNTAEAIRAASLDALERLRESGDGRHPYYWAGFMALGSGQ